MTLFEGKIKEEYEIKGFALEQSVTRRLEALGLNDGTKIILMNRKKNGALIIKVRGTRLALGKQIAQAIEVDKCK